MTTTLGDIYTSENDASYLEGILGDGWQSIPASEGPSALSDARARLAAQWEQEKSEFSEEMRFAAAVQAAMKDRGAKYGYEVYDDVARDLYGHHTPLTHRVICEVEGIAKARWRES